MHWGYHGSVLNHPSGIHNHWNVLYRFMFLKKILQNQNYELGTRIYPPMFPLFPGGESFNNFSNFSHEPPAFSSRIRSRTREPFL